jgi:hypothetical protein
MNPGAYAILVVLVLVIVAFAVYRARRKGGCSPACVSPQTCVGGSCVTACTTNKDCIPPQVCQGGVCLLPSGCPQPCTPPQVCQGTVCVTPAGCPQPCIAPQVCQGTVCVTPPPPVLYGINRANGGLMTMADPTAGAWTPIGPPAAMIGVKFNRKDGTIYAVGTDNIVFSYTPGVSSAWTPVPNSGWVADIAFDLAGNMYGVGTNGYLYTKGGNYANAWTVVGGADNSCCIQNIDFDGAGILYATGTIQSSQGFFAKASTDPTSAWGLITQVTPPQTFSIDRPTGAVYALDGSGNVVMAPNLKTGFTTLPSTCCLRAVSTAPGQ